MAFEKLQKTKVPGVFKQADGRYVAIATRKDIAGRQMKARRVLPEGTSLTAAAAAVEELRREMARPARETPNLRDGKQIVGAYAQRWIEARGRRLKPSAAQTYGAALVEHILPYLGDMACQNVTREVVEGWVIYVQEARQPSGKPYAQDTMRQWWRVLRTLLRDMAADLHLPDPTVRVRPPERPDQDPIREQRTLDASALSAMLDAAATYAPQRYAEVAVMALTGMRAGEVYALKWECVDFKSSTITVRRALSRGVLQETTKTKARRLVPMHPALAEILQEHRQKLVEDKHTGLEAGFVFPADHGGLREPSSAKKLWPLLQEALKTDIRIGPQVLRRSLNTQLVLQGVDRITLRSIMGHTSEAMTARYAGISVEAKADAVRGLAVEAKSIDEHNEPAMDAIPDFKVPPSAEVN